MTRRQRNWQAKSRAYGFEKRRMCFGSSDYEAVVKLCNAYPGNDVFTRLAKSNRVEQAALSDARVF